jgi:hypothetical protein
MSSTFRRRAWDQFLLPILFTLLLSTSGCVYLVVGGIGALGGYVVSPDTVEGVTSQDQTEVWDTASEIISIMGVIQEEQEAGGYIIGRVNGAKVTVTVVPIGTSSSKMRVKARKAFFPKISVAQDVYIKIMESLEE